MPPSPPAPLAPLHVRRYGTAGPWVAVLHGGPAAAGSAAGLARGLAEGFRVIEPWQRGSGDVPLTVARHVADLDDVLRDACPGERPAIVGESWGAMLALAWAAEHPDRAGPLALVGCGTFDATARARLRETLDARKTVELRERLARLTEACPDPAARTVAAHDLSRGLYSVGPLPEAPDDSPPFDLRAHKETWADMLRLQAEGVYPAAFAAIRSPVLMLHGDYDPHPGPMIYDGLLAAIPQLEYREYSQCGHHPWRERHVRAAFFADLASWLRVHSSGGL